MRYVIVDKEDKGIYLGSFWGLSFWSLLDAVGQDSVVTFDNKKDAYKYIESWESENNIENYFLVPLNIHKKYASVDDLINVGLQDKIGDMNGLSIQ